MPFFCNLESPGDYMQDHERIGKCVFADPKERSDPTVFSGAYPLFHWKDVVAGIERYLMQDESDTAGRYLTTVCRIVPIGKQRTGL